MKIRFVSSILFPAVTLVPSMKCGMVIDEFLLTDQRKRSMSVEAGRTATLRIWHLIFILKDDYDLNNTRGGGRGEVAGSRNHVRILVIEKHSVSSW